MKRLLIIVLLFLLLCSSSFGLGAYVAPNEDTLHFFGTYGNGSGVDSDNAGGCTWVAWIASGKNPLAFMTANGGHIGSASSGVAYDNDTHILSKAGLGSGVTVGTLVKVSGETHIAAGIYEITDVPDNDSLEVLDIVADGNEADVRVDIGGIEKGVASSSLQVILDGGETNAAAHSRIIYCNDADSTIIVTAPIDIDTGGGAYATNKWKKLIGCNTEFVPLTNGNYITLDAENADLGRGIIDINDVHNIAIENIYVKNNHDAGNDEDNGFYIHRTGNRYNFHFENCKVTDCYYGFYSSAAGVYNVSLIDCHVEDCYYGYYKLGHFSRVFNCFFKNIDSYSIKSYSNQINISDSVFTGVSRGVGVYGYGVNTISNCTFYNCSIAAVERHYTIGQVMLFNNIVWLATPAVQYAFFQRDGSTAFEDYNFTNCTKTEAKFSGLHSLNELTAAQIGFMDADNDDFRLKPTSYLLNRGMPTPGNGLFTNQGYTTPGAWQRISRIRR